jgi:hypothetical protein
MPGPTDILLPTAYFPPVSYFVHLSRSSNVFIEQMETFPKQTYRNRCEIMTSAGKLNLVVPVSRPNGNHTITKDIDINYNEPWNLHHWKSVQTAYRSSPYFNYYSDLFHPLFISKEPSLLAHNNEILSMICRILSLKITISLTNDYIKDSRDIVDLRKDFSPKKLQRGTLFHEYPQVFSHKTGFMPDLSILDLLFNMGPDAVNYVEKIKG